MEWTEIIMKVPSAQLEQAADMAQMAVDGGIYVEDYSHLEEEAREIAHIDLIDEELLAKDREHGLVHLYISPEENPKEALAFLRERCAGEGIDCEFSVESCAEEDWINNWKQYFKPLCVGEKLLIKPSWEKVAEGEKRKILEIDPASSFGTGQHNTTQLCLELVEKNLHEGDSILDLGCGSGILSIGALLLGAESATAVDVDENSVKIAKENAEKNHISAEKYTAYCGNIIDDKALVEQIGTGYDLLCANIVADVLIGMSGIFGGFIKDGGTLIVSGIIDQRKDEVLDRLKAEGFELIEIREKEDWVAASFRK